MHAAADFPHRPHFPNDMCAWRIGLALSWAARRREAVCVTYKWHFSTPSSTFGVIWKQENTAGAHSFMKSSTQSPSRVKLHANKETHGEVDLWETLSWCSFLQIAETIFDEGLKSHYWVYQKVSLLSAKLYFYAWIIVSRISETLHGKL